VSRGPDRSGAGALVVLVLLALLSSCGLPGEGSVTTVDDDEVPYRLLESDAPSAAATETSTTPGPVPMVFWLVNDDRLVPSATDASCDQAPEVVVERLLGELAAGPTDEARAAGRSSAIPPESTLALVDITEGTARVEVDAETAINADRLPVAVGQIVLTLTSVAGVRSVVLVSGAGPVQVPLPGGALTEDPVTATDYTVLLPDRIEQLREVGCPEPQ
jgi:hypothetical protein